MNSIYSLFSYTQLIEVPTRLTTDSATIIDHIATTSVRNIVKSGVLEIALNDHVMVYCVRKFNGAVKNDYKKIKTRTMKNFIEQAFLKMLLGQLGASSNSN